MTIKISCLQIDNFLNMCNEGQKFANGNMYDQRSVLPVIEKIFCASIATLPP